jgi:hypothetical protein
MPYYVLMSEGKPPNHAEKEMQVKVHKHTRVCFKIGNKKKKKRKTHQENNYSIKWVSCLEKVQTKVTDRQNHR